MEFEGFSAEPYFDIVGIKTIGFGRTFGPMSKTTKRAEQAWLLKEIVKINDDINELVPLTRLTQGQMAALISFVYNCGINAFRASTLRKRLNEGNLEAASNELLRWNKARGKVILGLTRRRIAEKKLFDGNYE